MPLSILRDDIRNISSDILVNPTDAGFSHSGGVDRMVREEAGEELERKCRELPELEVAQTVMTPAYDFRNYRYIIHVYGPTYIDGMHDEEKLLRDCYENCLKTAKDHSFKSITFPLISSGTFGFPKGKALRIAVDTIAAFLLEEEMDVNLLVYDRESYDTSSKLFVGVRDYLAGNAEKEKRIRNTEFRSAPSESIRRRKTEKTANMLPPLSGRHPFDTKKTKAESAPYEEETELNVYSSYSILPEESIAFEPDQSFGEYLIRLIDERNMKDADVYKSANINRDVFNKIINNKVKVPKKKTCVALAIGLKPDLKETNELLSKAGYVLSGSFVFDQIIIYCIRKKEYNIFEINEVLYENDQEILG